MPAYVIGDIAIHDPETYKEYAAGSGATAEAAGGRYLVRGGDPETLEGDWSAGRMVILEFPDRDAARAWIDGQDYAPLRAKRQAASTGRFILVDGVQP